MIISNKKIYSDHIWIRILNLNQKLFVMIFQQDKIRLIQEDLETERELRQRVSWMLYYLFNIFNEMIQFVLLCPLI